MNEEEHKVPIHKNNSFNNHNNSMSNYGNKNYQENNVDFNNKNYNENGFNNNMQNQQNINGTQQQQQQSSNQKYLQNYLNQNLSQSDIQQDNQVNVQNNVGQNLKNNYNINNIYQNNNNNNMQNQQQQQQISSYLPLNNLNNSNLANNNSHQHSKFKIPGEISPILTNQQQQQYAHQRRGSGCPDSALGINQINNNNSILPVPTIDPRKNDNNYVCLYIKKMEFFCSKINLEKHSNYLFRIFERQEQNPIPQNHTAQIRIQLPENTKPDILLMFIDHIDKGKDLPSRIDLYIAQNIVIIAEALKMRTIQKKFLMEIIMPMLNRENVLFFIKMAYNKLSDSRGDEEDDNKQGIDHELESVTTNKQEEDFWLEFLSYTLDLAAANIQYILKRKSVELHGVLEPNIIDEIIERAIKFYRADLNYDSTLLFETLMKLRGCDSIFQLLDQEKRKIIENEEAILKSGVKPILTWKVQNLSGNFYRESDGFWVENAQWKLAISYFSNEEDSLSVQLKMISNPFDVKHTKDYFKKKDFFLPSNIGGVGNNHYQNPIDDYEEYEIRDQEELKERRKLIEKANAEYPSHSYITMVSAVRIHQNEELKEPQIQSLICSSKAPAILKKFEGFYPEDYDGEVTIEIYFKVKFIYSAILHYITRNFTYLITDPIIYQLPKDQFKLILKHKFLSVTQEDEIVKALCLWVEGQEPRDQMKAEISELLENIQWNYVSIACILDVIRNFSYIRRHESFKKIILDEFNMRLKFKADSTKLQPPRFCYKYNKTQTNPDSVTKNSKNAKALLYVNHEEFFQKLLDQLLEPIDIIRAHLVNEGVSEQSHKKFLELQLLQKQKEMQEIETQLNNMKLIEEMDQSRSNSRLNNRSNANASQSKGFQGGRSSIGDDQETVKNSMINLLNVIDGGAIDQSNINQQQQYNGQSNLLNISNNFGEHLRNVSQDFVQKLHFNNNQEKESPFDMYENQQQPGKQNKVKILFQSIASDEDDQQDKNDDNYFYKQTDRENPNGCKVGGDNMTSQNNDDDEEDDEDEEEEEKEVFNAENINRTSNNNQINNNTSTFPPTIFQTEQTQKPQNNNNLQHNESQLSQEFRDFNPVADIENINNINNVNLQQKILDTDPIPSFNNNSIILGGGQIVQQSFDRQDNSQQINIEKQVYVHENKEIQTSLHLILTTSKKFYNQQSLESARSNSINMQMSSQRQNSIQNNMNNNNIKKQVTNIDQCIQISLQSKRDSNIQQQKIYVDCGIQFEEIDFNNHIEENQTETKLRIQQQRSQTIQDNNNDRLDLQCIHSQDQVNIQKDNEQQQQSQIEKTSNNIVTIQSKNKLRNQKSNNSSSIDLEQEISQSYMSQNLLQPNQDSQEQEYQRPKTTQNIHNNDIIITSNNDQKYIQDIKEYTQFIQNLSKDAFDNNFLDQYSGTQNINNSNINDQSSYPVSFDNRTADQTQLLPSKQHQYQNRVGSCKPKQQSSNLLNSNSKSVTTQPFTPMSNNAQNRNNLSGFQQYQNVNNLNSSMTTNQNQRNLNQSKLKSIKSPKQQQNQNTTNNHHHNYTNSNMSIIINNTNSKLNNSNILNNTQMLNQTDTKSQSNINDSYIVQSNTQKGNNNQHQRAKSQTSVVQQKQQEAKSIKTNAQQRNLGNQVNNLNTSNNNSKQQISLKQINKNSNFSSTRNKTNISYVYNNSSGHNSVKHQYQNSQISNFNQTVNNININTINQKNTQRQKSSLRQSSNCPTTAQTNKHLSKFNTNNNNNNKNQQHFQSIPVSTKHNNQNRNVLSLQKLLEGTNQSMFSINFNSSSNNNNVQLDQNFSVPESIMGWSNTQEQLQNFISNNNNQMQQLPQNKNQNTIPTTTTLQQNFITNQIHMNEIKNPGTVQFDITAQLANYNILDHIQQQHQMQHSQQYYGINKNNIGINQNKYRQQQQQQLPSSLLSYVQSPSSQYQQNLNNIYLDISRIKSPNVAGITQPNTATHNYYNINLQNQLGTIEEISKQSDIQTSYHNNNNDSNSQYDNKQHKRSVMNNTQNLINFQQYQRSLSLNQTQPLQQLAMPIQNAQSHNTLSGMISPQSILSNNQLSNNTLQQQQQQQQQYGNISNNQISNNQNENIPITNNNSNINLQQTIGNDSSNERGGLIQ